MNASIEPNLRLLVVDDNPSIHDDFRKILIVPKASNTSLAAAKKALFGREVSPSLHADFQIDFALQGQEALEKVKEAQRALKPYALAFVDVRMPPGWDGIETIGHLWQADPDLQVVICTAYSDYSWDDIVKRLQQPDSLVILKKPFDHAEVLQLAHALTKKWLMTQQARLEMHHLEEIVVQRTSELQKANLSLTQQIRERARAEERFAKAFKASPVPLAIRSLNKDQYVDVNERFLEMTGFDWVEVVGHSVSELGLWVQTGQEERMLQRLREQKQVSMEECQVRDRSGNQRTALLSAELFDLDEEPHVLMILQDVTERINLENQLRQSQKMEAIGQLAAGVAHDFNNLLTVIHGYASLCLAKSGVEPEIGRAMEQVKDAADRAAALTRQLLAFSRRQLLQREPLAINDVIDQMRDMLKRLIGENIALECDLGPFLPSIIGDQANIGQVILNLVVNARDAMPGGGRLKLKTGLIDLPPSQPRSNAEARPGRFVCLSVTDTGVGMEAGVLSRLFEPFYTTKPVGRGTGLGLSTVYGIIKQHQGWVEVSSQPGQGSTFEVYLPVPDKPAVAQAPAAQEPRPVASSKGETVLVVEDESALRELVCKTLSQQGYQVLQAATGHEALAVWRNSKRKIDLLLTDIVMPDGMSGINLAEKLLKEAGGIRVVLTSGYTDERLELSSLKLDDINFLPKPYQPTKLLEAVRSALDIPDEVHTVNN
jgi:PAS domain S-box-containing protein